MNRAVVSSQVSSGKSDRAAKVAEVAIDDATVRDRLAEYLRVATNGPVELETFERHSSGFSWVTYSFVARYPGAQPRKLILRVGPPNGLFAPYSVLPQVHALQVVTG